MYKRKSRILYGSSAKFCFCFFLLHKTNVASYGLAAEVREWQKQLAIIYIYQ